MKSVYLRKKRKNKRKTEQQRGNEKLIRLECTSRRKIQEKIKNRERNKRRKK
jgi:hypothetical protein